MSFSFVRNVVSDEADPNGPIAKNPPPPQLLALRGEIVDRVNTFKLLGNPMN